MRPIQTNDRLSFGSTSRSMLAVFGALVPALSACASDGPPAQRTVNVGERLTNEFDALGANATAVVDAIARLRESFDTTGIINREVVEVGDLNGSFKSFQKAVDGVQSSRKQLASSRASLKSAMDSYLAKWDKDIASYESEDLKQRSQERRDDGLTRFTRITEELGKGGQAVDAYLARLDELESALANDLNAAGVKALDSELKKASSDSEKLAETASDVADKLKTYVGSLKASGAEIPSETPQ
jgi:predicted  nucleic acid-binding Zn-ribbon protein